jgi:hypothetical protein
MSTCRRSTLPTPLTTRLTSVRCAAACPQGPCKRLYVIGGIEERNNALDQAEDVVRFKLTGQSSRPGRHHPPDRRPYPPDHRGAAGPAAPPPASWHDERPPPGRYRPYEERPPPPRGFDDRPPPPRDDMMERGPYRPPAPAPPREYEDRGGSSAARYDERAPPPRYDECVPVSARRSRKSPCPRPRVSPCLCHHPTTL